MYSNIINFKNRDTLEENTQLIPLLSDISDTEGVLAEHIVINGVNNKHLDFALIKLEGDYYFCNVKDMVAELKHLTDNKQFICPYCKQDLNVQAEYLRTDKTKVRAHLRHYSNNTKNKDCIFNNHNADAHILKEKIYSGETMMHRVLKHEVYMKAKKGELFFEIPKSYELITDEENFNCRVHFYYETYKVKDVDIEVQVLKKDDLTAGYRPDLYMLLDNEENLFCEITYQSGKTVKEYYDIWKRLNSTVIEVRKSDNFIGYDFIDELDQNTVYLDEDLVFRFLYNDVIDKAREAKFKMMKVLADKQVKYLKLKEQKRKEEEIERQRYLKYMNEEKIRLQRQREDEEKKREEESKRLLKQISEYRVQKELEIKEKKVFMKEAERESDQHANKEDGNNNLKEILCKSKQCQFFNTCLIKDKETLNRCTGKLVKTKTNRV